MGRGAHIARRGTRRKRALNLHVSPLSWVDFDAWRTAYAAYATSVDSPVDDDIAQRVWAWLLAPDDALEGIAAFDGGELVGFAHFRAFPRTLDGNHAGFLDDLFVTPSYRGSPVARLLFERIETIARERGWTHVRWVTNANNAHARRLYEQIARPVDVLTFRLDTSDRR